MKPLEISAEEYRRLAGVPVKQLSGKTGELDGARARRSHYWRARLGWAWDGNKDGATSPCYIVPAALWRKAQAALKAAKGRTKS